MAGAVDHNNRESNRPDIDLSDTSTMMVPRHKNMGQRTNATPTCSAFHQPVRHVDPLQETREGKTRYPF
jgi:hypothetical protein